MSSDLQFRFLDACNIFRPPIPALPFKFGQCRYQMKKYGYASDELGFPIVSAWQDRAFPITADEFKLVF